MQHIATLLKDCVRPQSDLTGISYAQGEIMEIRRCGMPRTVVFLLSIAAFVLFAAGSAFSQTRTVNIKFWNWLPDLEKLYWESAVADYNAANPSVNLNIEYVKIPYASFAEEFERNLADPNSLPDILSIEFFHWPFYLDKGLTDNFVDLTPHLTKQAENLSEANLAEYTFGGKKFAVSYQAAPFIFAYREDILSANGIKTPIDTWSDFYVAAEKLKPKGIQLTLMDVRETQVFYSLFLQRGGQVYDSDQRYVFDNYRTEAVDVLKFLYDLKRNNLVPAADLTDFLEGRMRAPYNRGQIAGISAGDWVLPKIKEMHPQHSGSWRVQKLPAWPENDFKGVAYGGTGFAIVDRPDRSVTDKQIIAEFVTKSVLSLKNQARFYGEHKMQPTNLSLFNNKSAILLRDSYYGDQQLALTLREAIKNSAPRNVSSSYYEFMKGIEKVITEVMAGRKTPEQALETFSL